MLNYFKYANRNFQTIKRLKNYALKPPKKQKQKIIKGVHYLNNVDNSKSSDTLNKQMKMLKHFKNQINTLNPPSKKNP